jgi:hypothetical protein
MDYQLLPLNEREWQLIIGSERMLAAWHAQEHTGPDAAHGTSFLPGIGTVRECSGCGCLVGGGPTRCLRCARERSGLWRRLRRWLSSLRRWV